MAPLLLLLAVLALAGYRSAGLLRSGPAQAFAPYRAATAGSVDLGVTTAALARNEWRPWSLGDLREVDAFERIAHRHVSVVMWYADWQHSSVSLSQLRAVARRGSVPEITWEPWDYTQGPYHSQPAYSLESIADGSHDAYIRSWARALAAYGGPVRLRFAQEMNGDWYPWSEGFYGNSRGSFVRAWRHVHDVFEQMGARNVSWVWSPVAVSGSVIAQEYPGDAYVDVVGLSLFNGGSQLRYERWHSFAQKVDPALAQLRQIAHHKPVEISEVGVAERGGSKARWIEGMFQTLAAHPEIVSLVWFDVATSSDWRIETSPAAEQAFAQGATSPRFR